MNKYIALVAAREYLPEMNEIDRHILDSSDIQGRAPCVVRITTAAGKEVGSAKSGRHNIYVTLNEVKSLPRITREDSSPFQGSE
ncbi:MAG: hypothetical protein QGM50_05220 [Anaerolineae bacterium]|nr:hypothetical protein [Anaerolineae bacterium]MDK1081579.1 hypothetical protein [Anaerolineae bacterium]MDK1118177.1 hypothetical protein [Anaerolineae bacterium]